MKWIEAKVVIESKDPEQAVDRISQTFYDLGVKGLVIDDPGLDPPEGWGDDALEKPVAHAVTGYFADNASGRAQLDSLRKRLEDNDDPLYGRLRCTVLDEEDWAESWKEHFEPRKVGARIVIKPTWRSYTALPDDIVLEIDPGMAFGTGTHPTTRMCIELLEKHLKPGDAFLDVGTGSGILLLTAAGLGAGRVMGVDSDPMAVEIAEKNLRANDISIEKFRVVAGDLIDPVDERFDLAAANILAEVVLKLVPGVCRVLRPGGIFICSGIIEEKLEEVLSGLESAGFSVVEVVVREKWAGVAARADRTIFRKTSGRWPQRHPEEGLCRTGKCSTRSTRRLP
jgi:ribosomal protein L11 methyltransferase